MRSGFIRIFTGIVMAQCVAGCVPTRTKYEFPRAKPGVLNHANKVAVVCFQADLKTNQRVEAYMDDPLRQHGIEGLPLRKLIVKSPDYSPQDLMIQLKQA